MSYKIGEFCRLIGVSPDTLRYYERLDLLSAIKNPQNNYRSFTREDAPDIWNLLMLRSLDMGLRDIEEIRRHGSFESQSKYLQMRESALTNEIERLIAKRERLRQLSRLYDAVHYVDKAPIQKTAPANYALFVLGDGCEPNEQVLSEISRWINCLPFTYFAAEIPFASLVDQREELTVRLGLGILEENLDKANIVPPKEALYTPALLSVRMAVCTRDVFSLCKKDLAPLYAFLKENHMRILGAASGRIICSNCKAKDPEYILGFSVPVNICENTP